MKNFQNFGIGFFNFVMESDVNLKCCIVPQTPLANVQKNSDLHSIIESDVIFFSIRLIFVAIELIVSVKYCICDCTYMYISPIGH